MNTNTDFVLMKKRKKKEPVMQGHGTQVQKRQAADAFFVEKSVKPNGVYDKCPDKWLDKNVRAKNITDKIRQKNNGAYHVPKMFISHGKVKEEYVDAIRLRDISKKWQIENQPWIFEAVAQFINDMSELKPVKKYEKPNDNLCFMYATNLTDFQKSLDSRGKNLISEDNKKLLGRIYKFLRDLPENQEMVFGHNDLHADNIFIDMKNKKLFIIDFELAGWRSKMWGMYCQISSSKIWNILNKLPRTTNPNLKWDFNYNVFMLVKFMRWLQMELKMDFDAERLQQKIQENCVKAEYHLRRAILDGLQKNTENLNTAVVQASLYQKN